MFAAKRPKVLGSDATSTWCHTRVNAAAELPILCDMVVVVVVVVVGLVLEVKTFDENVGRGCRSSEDKCRDYIMETSPDSRIKESAIYDLHIIYI